MGAWVHPCVQINIAGLGDDLVTVDIVEKGMSVVGSSEEGFPGTVLCFLE